MVDVVLLVTQPNIRTNFEVCLCLVLNKKKKRRQNSLLHPCTIFITCNCTKNIYGGSVKNPPTHSPWDVIITLFDLKTINFYAGEHKHTVTHNLARILSHTLSTLSNIPAHSQFIRVTEVDLFFRGLASINDPIILNFKKPFSSMSIGNLWKEALVLFNNNPNSDVIAVSSKISWLVPPCCL